MEQKNENELLKLAENLSKFGTWELDLKTNELYWSDGVFRICGYEPGEFEVTFESGLAVVHPDDQEMAKAKMMEAITQGTPYEIRKRFVTKNNDVIHILSRGKLVFDENEKPLKLFGIFQDVTNEVQLEESYRSAIQDLSSRNQFIQTIVEKLPIGIAVNKISTGEATMVNRSFASTYGWSDQDLTDIQSFFEKVYPDENYRKEIMERILADIASGDPKKMNWEGIEITTSANEKRIVNAKNIPIYEQDLMISTVFDVTDNAKLTQKTKTQEANLQSLIENSPDLIYSVDINFKLLTFNSAFSTLIKNLTGVDIYEGINVFELYSDRKKKLYLSIYNEVKKGNRYVFVDIVKFPNYDLYFEVAVNPIFNSESKTIGYSIFSRNITEQKKIAEDKSKLTQELQKIMDSSLDVICTIDNNNHFVKVSAASEKVWGYKPEELEGKHYNILVHPEDIVHTNDTSAKIIEGLNLTNFENRNIKKDGTIVPMIWSAKYDEKEQLTYCIAKDATEIKQTQDKLKLSEQYFKSLIQDGSDLIGILDTEGNYTYVSPTSQSILGIAPEEFIGKSAFDFIHPEDVATVAAQFERLSSEKRINLKPFRFKHQDGTWHWVETIVTNLLEDPAVKGIVANSRDITFQKNNQKALEQSHQLLKNAQKITKMGNWEYRTDTKEMFWAEEICQIFEIEPFSRTLSLSDFIRFIHPEDVEDFKTAFEQLINEGTPLNFQHRVITANQNIKHVKELGERIFDEETKSWWIWASIRDNTEAISNIIELKQSEEKYKYLFENNPACMYIFDFETLEILDCNEEALMQYGYTREEFLSLSIRDIRPKVDIDLINYATKDEETYGKIHKKAWRHQKKNGDIFYVNINGHLIDYKGRRCSLVQITDITAQLRAQEEIRISEEKYRILYQESPVPKVIYDAKDLTILDVNNVAAQLYGYTREDFIGKTIYDLRIPEEHESVKEIFKKIKTLVGSADFGIFKHRKKDGTLLEVELFAHKFNFEGKEALIAVYTDVTEKQQALKALQDREEKLLLAQSLAKIGNWDYDMASQKFTWSDEMFRIFEIDKRTFDLNNTGSLINFIDPEDQKKANAIRDEALATGNSFKTEYRITTKKGKKKVIEEVGYGERDEKGTLIRFFGTSQDITERKKAEEQIKESELKYRSFFENSMDGILLTVTDGAILAANPAACEIFKMTEAEILKKGRMGLVDQSDPRLYELLERRQKKGNARGELRLMRKDGSIFEGELASTRFLDSQGRERTSMIIRDVTKQKEYEKTIIESNQRFEYVTQATSDAIWDWDLTKDSIFWGSSFANIFNFKKEEIQPDFNFWREKVHPDDLERVEKGLKDLIESKESKWTDEYRMKNGDGKYRYVYNQGFVIRDNEGKALRMVGAMNDITQRKIEEERLKLLESVVTNTNDSIIITEAEPFDLPGPRIVYVNDAFTQMTGYLPEEVIGKTPRVLQGPLTDRASLAKLSKALKNWESCEITTINYKKDGTPFWINFSVSPVADETGWFTHWIAIERDVTDVKHTEELLRNALDEKNSILESIGDGFFAVNKDFTITYWNINAEKLLYTKKEDALGNNLWDVFVDSLDSKSYLEYHKALRNNQKVQFEDYYQSTNKWYEISVYPNERGLSVYFKDISERVSYMKAIELRNKQLQEIAYTQSHIVRAPLARILGIINLIRELDVIPPNSEELLNYLFMSASELDDVIKGIVRNTEHTDN